MGWIGGVEAREGKGTFLFVLLPCIQLSAVQSNKLMDEERDACATVTMTIAPGGSQETRAATDFCLRRACASLRVCSAERQSAMVRSSATRVDSVETRERAEELSAAVQCSGRSPTSSSVAQRGTTQNKQKRRQSRGAGGPCAGCGRDVWREVVCKKREGGLGWLWWWWWWRWKRSFVIDGTVAGRYVVR